MALMVNLAMEYWIADAFEYVPRTLALSLGGSPVETAVLYLTIVAWRILYAASASSIK